MNRSLTIDLPSVAIGGAAAVLLAVTMGFSQVSSTPTGPQRPGPHSVLAGNLHARPAARDLVFIKHDAPLYTVPVGKILVIVGVGETGPNTGPAFREVGLVIDGQPTGFQFLSNSLDTWNFWTGIPVAEGSTVDLSYNPATGFTAAYITGYLEDA